MECVGSLCPNKHTIQVVIAALKAQSTVSSTSNINLPVIFKSELDSHTNMVVLGKKYFIFESTGNKCNVGPFTSELGIAQNIPIVYAAVAYDCQYSYITYI